MDEVAALRLREKYRLERDKRLRADGDKQYVDPRGEFASFVQDRHLDERLEREPYERQVEVLVLGGGFAGLLASAELHKKGVTDICIVEQGGDFGGTWYWNRYPGIRCDIESYIYLPLVEEVGTVPREKYATGAEIFAHCQAIGRRFDLYPKALFQTQVTSIRWNEDARQWRVETDRGDVITAKFVVAGVGPVHLPKLPGIPGIGDFEGRAFHTSRWDYGYTGGSSDGGLKGLKDKRVAVIGTGATAVQVVPNLARWAKELYVFQRTPSAIDERNNRATDVEWFGSLESGWQTRRRENFLSFLLGMSQPEDMVADKWTETFGELSLAAREDIAGLNDAEKAELMQAMDFRKMEQLRARVDAIVKDEDAAAALKPWYNWLCKRPLFSDEYLQAFNDPAVHLVDTQGRGVEAIAPGGPVFDGRTYEVDCIVFATGFQFAAYSFEAGRYELVGRNQQSMKDHWASGVRSLHGMHIHGFPNFFFIGGAHHAALYANYTHVLQDQSIHLADIVARCGNDGVDIFEITADAEERWAEEMAARAVDRSAFEAECTPSYINNEGVRDGDRPTLASILYGGGPIEYMRLLKDWRENHFDRDRIKK